MVNSQKSNCKIVNSTPSESCQGGVRGRSRGVCRTYMLCCCIGMHSVDERREHSLCSTGAFGDFEKSLSRSGTSPTSLARVLCRTQQLLKGEFRVSPRNIPCGVSLPGGGTTGVGVDEWVEGASERHPGFVLLNVDQVDYSSLQRG